MARAARKSSTPEAPVPPPKGEGRGLPPSTTSKLSKYQKFTPGRVHRRQLTGAEYNPRFISDHAAKQLREVLQKFGLVEPLVWNKRTGNLVGGHQRIAQLDALDAHDGGTGDYELDVAIVDVPLKREKELNVVLNNPEIQGEYDPFQLGALFREISPEDVKFSTFALESHFSGTEYEDLYQPPVEPEDADGDADKINAVGVIAAPVAADADAPNGRMVNGEAIRDPAAHAALIEERNKMRERVANDPLRETDFYLMIVCGTKEEALDLGSHFGAKERYIDAHAVYAKIGVEPPTTEQA